MGLAAHTAPAVVHECVVGQGSQGQPRTAGRGWCTTPSGAPPVSAGPCQQARPSQPTQPHSWGYKEGKGRWPQWQHTLPPTPFVRAGWARGARPSPELQPGVRPPPPLVSAASQDTPGPSQAGLAHLPRAGEGIGGWGQGAAPPILLFSTSTTTRCAPCVCRPRLLQGPLLEHWHQVLLLTWTAKRVLPGPHRVPGLGGTMCWSQGMVWVCRGRAGAHVGESMLSECPRWSEPLVASVKAIKTLAPSVPACAAVSRPGQGSCRQLPAHPGTCVRCPVVSQSGTPAVQARHLATPTTHTNHTKASHSSLPHIATSLATLAGTRARPPPAPGTSRPAWPPPGTTPGAPGNLGTKGPHTMRGVRQESPHSQGLQGLWGCWQGPREGRGGLGWGPSSPGRCPAPHGSPSAHHLP